ncbi:MAG: DegV family protein [Lachnospiraceae bacterium]|nr:DegV family protein [Lachnospiraceae bacterium]
MAKVAIVTDTNSGIMPPEAQQHGVYVFPMPFTIDDADYLEAVNLSRDQFYEKMEAGADIKTSQPSLETLMKLWEELLQEYDEIVHIPMSSGLSGSYQSARMLAEDYDGKVFVVNNQRISVTQRQSVLDAKEMADNGATGQEILEFLEQDKFNSSIYIMLNTLQYLKKGGRITPAAAAIGTMLKLKPVLTIQGDKLDAFSKARTSSQGKNTMINALKNDLENRFGNPGPEGARLFVAHTHDEAAALAFKAEIEAAFPGYDIYMDELPLSISTHIGPGALGIACTLNH